MTRVDMRAPVFDATAEPLIEPRHQILDREPAGGGHDPRRRRPARNGAGRLGPVEDSYKLGCKRGDRHISASNPLIGEPRDFINEDVEFRQFSCPGCGALIENEVAVASDPVLEDIRLACDVPATETT